MKSRNREPEPLLTALVLALAFVFLAEWVLLEFRGCRRDGNRAAHGYGLKHPNDRKRAFLR